MCIVIVGGRILVPSTIYILYCVLHEHTNAISQQTYQDKRNNNHNNNKKKLADKKQKLQHQIKIDKYTNKKIINNIIPTKSMVIAKKVIFNIFFAGFVVLILYLLSLISRCKTY